MRRAVRAAAQAQGSAARGLRAPLPAALERRQAGGRRRALLWLALALPLASCAALGPPTSIDIPEARLRELVARPFPIERRLLDIVDLRVDNPRLALDAPANRLAIELDVRVGQRLTHEVFRGALSSSAGLRFEPADSTLRLTDARVDRFDLDGVPASFRRRFDQIGRPAAAALLEDRVVYTLPAATASRLADAGLTVADVRVTEAGLRIGLAPRLP